MQKQATKGFNLFDLLILLAIVGIILGAVFRAEIKAFLFADEDMTYTVELRTDDAENNRLALLTSGCELWFSDQSALLGTVVSCVTTPVTETYIIDGEERQAQSTTRSAAVVTLTVPGYRTGDLSYAKNGTALRVNDAITLVSAGAIYELRIVSVEKKTDNG